MNENDSGRLRAYVASCSFFDRRNLGCCVTGISSVYIDLKFYTQTVFESVNTGQL